MVYAVIQRSTRVRAYAGTALHVHDTMFRHFRHLLRAIDPTGISSACLASRKNTASRSTFLSRVSSSSLCLQELFFAIVFRHQHPRVTPEQPPSNSREIILQVVFISCICLSFWYYLQYSEPTDHQDITRLCTPSNSACDASGRILTRGLDVG